MKSSRKILFAIHDPGGSMAALPVILALKGEKTTAYLGSYAKERIQVPGLVTKDLPTDLTEAQAEAIFESNRPDVLCTGTSWKSNAEQVLRNIAFKRNIRSIVILDDWKDFSVRFDGATYSASQSKDIICVPGQLVKDEMLTAGFLDENIVVTGQPNFERLSKEAVPASNNQNNHLNKFLFLSEPLTGDIKPKQNIIELFCDAISKSSWAQNNQSTEITLKFHPKEDSVAEKMEATQRISTPDITVKIAEKNLTLPAGFPEFNLVVGYQSRGLLEAAALGCKVVAIPTFELSPALAEAFHLFAVPMAKTTQEDLVRTLNHAHTNKIKRKPLFEGAAQRISKIILD